MGMVWYGMVWYGMVWYGMVWYGMVWYGMVWYGMVWYGMVCDKTCMLNCPSPVGDYIIIKHVELRTCCRLRGIRAMQLNAIHTSIHKRLKSGRARTVGS